MHESGPPSAPALAGVTGTAGLGTLCCAAGPAGVSCGRAPDAVCAVAAMVSVLRVPVLPGAVTTTCPRGSCQSGTLPFRSEMLRTPNLAMSINPVHIWWAMLAICMCAGCRPA